MSGNLFAKGTLDWPKIFVYAHTGLATDREDSLTDHFARQPFLTEMQITNFTDEVVTNAMTMDLAN